MSIIERVSSRLEGVTNRKSFEHRIDSEHSKLVGRLEKRLINAHCERLFEDVRDEIFPDARIVDVPFHHDREIRAMDYLGLGLFIPQNAEKSRWTNIDVEFRAYRGGLRRNDVLRLVVGSRGNNENWLRRGQWSKSEFMEELLLVRLDEASILPPAVRARLQSSKSELRSKRFTQEEL